MRSVQRWSKGAAVTLAGGALLLSSACIIIPIPTGGGGSPRTEPVELKSECARTVYLFVGDRPGPDAPRTPLGPKEKTLIARRRDGSATVWVFDEGGRQLASAQLSPDAEKAVLEKSCTSLSE